MSEQADVGLVPQPENQPVGGEQQGPEQQRSFLPGPKRGELVRRGQIAIAVMKNVGDGEIILEGRHHQHHRGEKNYREAGDAGAPRGFTQPFGTRSLADERQNASQERIGTQGQREEERKTAYLRHGGILARIFSETAYRSNHGIRKTPNFQSLVSSELEMAGVSQQPAELRSAAPGRARPDLRVQRDGRNFLLPMRFADGSGERESRAQR